ncbi:uncharacterized protein A1O9_00112 [Exophiala aquamarina CBS 119918]|uniref:HIG1 domain-containing protein n=1 Tax=Exophiala aquamarina CBS 119918 TaxID=1182545 RepID=A0A072Q2K6_9EURO|nr:uncharacterized protein A1O9_00112 [Exophiala aquamarina CBS 119918]KEF62140.1 hypothetical protein A1O9_00112 [Exophiala aquamarina CBS 119918]
MSNPDPSPSSEPSPLSSSAIPSSFDSSPEFFEESRTQKLFRKIRQEPLIPVGCAATCYALYMATKSIRAGDHHQTNRMFRARIYAQGFTLLALVAGSIFYKDERMRRKQFESAIEEKKSAEKRDKWIRELEARDQEDREWRERIENSGRDVKDEARQAVGTVAEKIKEQQEQDGEGQKRSGGWFSSKSVKEEVDRHGWGLGTWARRSR